MKFKGYLSLVSGFIIILVIIGLIISSSDDNNFERDYDNIHNPDSIDITFELQDIYPDKGQKVVVWIKNNSSRHFDGSVSMFAKDFDSISIARENLYMDKPIPPGQQTWAIMWIKDHYRLDHFKYDLDGRFL